MTVTKSVQSRAIFEEDVIHTNITNFFKRKGLTVTDQTTTQQHHNIIGTPSKSGGDKQQTQQQQICVYKVAEGIPDVSAFLDTMVCTVITPSSKMAEHMDAHHVQNKSQFESIVAHGGPAAQTASLYTVTNAASFPPPVLALLYTRSVKGIEIPTLVVDFPPSMCNGGSRADFVLCGCVMISLVSTSDGSTLSIPVGELSAHTATNSETSLGEKGQQAWRVVLESTLSGAADGLDTMRPHLATVPARSMKSLAATLNVMSADLSSFAVLRCVHADIWKKDIAAARRVLEAAILLCQKWIVTTTDLCTSVWKDRWDGEPFADHNIIALSTRLENILNVRNTLAEIKTLFTMQEQMDLRVDLLLVPFQPLDSLNYSRATTQAWQAAMDEFGQRVDGMASAVSQKVSASDWMRYPALVRRPAVHATMKGPIESWLAGQSKKLLEIAQCKPKDATPMAALRLARESFGRLDTQLRVPDWVLKAVAQSSTFVETRNTLIQNLKKTETESLSNWGKDLEAIRFDYPVITITFDAESRFLVCTVDEIVNRVVTDARSVSAFGLVPPVEAKRSITHANTLFKAATTLQQLVSLHNSVQTQMLECTVPLLRDQCSRVLQVLNFNENITEFKLTFTQGSDAEMLCQRLQTAVEALNSQNRVVRRAHAEIGSMLSSLIEVDLLRNADKWKAILKELRGKFDALEKSSGRTAKDLHEFRRHWDYQLYKIMEHQYQIGLEALNDLVPEKNVNLVVSNGHVAYDPPLETLRESYYQAMKDFVSIPFTMKGFGGSEFFRYMPDNNAVGLTTVYTKATELFNKLNKLRKKFREYVVLAQCGVSGAPDMETFAEQILSSETEWAMNYKSIKQRVREVGDIEDEIRIECFVISTAPIKATVEDHLGKLAEALTVTLRKSALAHLQKIEKFLEEATDVLQTTPASLDEVGLANKRFNDVKEQVAGIQQEWTDFFGKNKLLKTVSGVSLDYTIMQQRWDKFQEAQGTFAKVIDAQLDKMRDAVEVTVQRYLKDLQKFQALWRSSKPKNLSSMTTRTELRSVLTVMQELESELEELRTRGTDLKAQCGYFGLPEPLNVLALLQDIEKETSDSREMWSIFESFDADFDTLRTEDWLSFRSRTAQFEDLVKSWMAKLQTQPQNEVVACLTATILEWARLAPLLKLVRGDGMTPDHWSEMFRLLEMEKGMTSDKLTFGHILDHHHIVVKKETELRALHARAQGEIQIRDALQEVRTWAHATEFKLVPHPDPSKKIQLISEWKELLTALSDNNLLISSLKDSPYFGAFSDEALGWESKLVLVEEYLHALNNIQRRWLHLEPIFARGALPAEQPRFKRVDREYVGIMRDIESDPRVMSLAQQLTYRDRFKAIAEQLERCQKALNEFLEQKRDKFSRFYFISDDDLLEILGQSNNPAVIQAHLKKLFMGINTVTIAGEGQEGRKITHMMSSEGEVVELLKPVPVQGEVEDWLMVLDDGMKATLRQSLVDCVAKQDIEKHCSQLLNLTESIQFTKAVEQSIPAGDYSSLKALLQRDLKDKTSAQGSADRVTMLKLKALILDGIHFIDVVDQLVAAKASRVNDWAWKRQLRFYLEGDHSTVSMVDARFNYAYEYQGNAPKLVHTPLTDRCYLTLTQGMALGYGGNPYGPAGTGKTESVKALGNALGRQVLVFNCDEGIDFKAMGRIFVGLVKCGAWGCFDEFNRLKVDQLSAVSQMIQVIQEALKQGDEACELLGRNIRINANAGIFVTLNPAGKGYGGRSKLPDNLKQLFRAVAMTVPDNELIAETILYSEGFSCGKELARKLVETFRLCKQTLSAQQHYDWGLRSLKAILRMGGVLIEQSRDQQLDSKAEHEIIIKAIRVNTLSKLTLADSVRFEDIIQDVFPDVEVSDIEYGKLREAIVNAVSALKLQLIEGQIQKVLQLYEAMRQRMGVVLVGPSGSGKSTLLRVLQKAMIDMGTEVPRYTINPKAISRNQLLGHMDLDTREWHDGVLTSAAKKVVKESQDVHSWIYCDGDIDPEWVEALNSVLDDNKLLTMPNGVRIQFGNNVNFVFETHSLQYASPATVSRMGMIFLSEEDVDMKSAVASWLVTQPEELRANLEQWMDQYFYPVIERLTKKHTMVLRTTRMGLVMSGLCQLQGVSSKPEFAIGLIRGLGAFVDQNDRSDFAKIVFELTGEQPLDASNPLDCYYSSGKKRFNAYRYEPNNTHTVDDLKQQPIVRTKDLRRNADIVLRCIEVPQPRPFFLVGPEGCGKSLLLRYVFSKLKSTKVAYLNCNAQTTAVHVIQKLMSSCQVFSTNHGRVLRPGDSERLILYLKDVNLPRPDHYGTVQLQSFLQQLILYKGFYDNDLEWIGVERVHVVASMNSQGSLGRHPVAPRLAAIVSIISVSYPDKESLKNIFTEYMNAAATAPALQSTGLWGGNKAGEIAQMMTTVYEKVKARFNVDLRAHYVFNPRDLAAWITNLLNYDLGSNDPWDVLAYEGCRIFSDRLVSPEHRKKFEKILYDQLAAAGYTRSNESKSVYTTWAVENTDKLLSSMSMTEFGNVVKGATTSYCREYRELNMFTSAELLEWVARVDRVMSLRGGHLLLVGRAGVGRREIISVVCHHLKIEVKELNMGTDYGKKQFKADIKHVMQIAGVEGRPVALVVEDHNFVDSFFLEVLNSVITNGDVPGLYTQDEMDQLLSAVKDEAGEASEGLAAFFVSRIVKYLHVVLIMDPTNSNFELNCQSNPAVYTRTQVCWMGTWNPETLQLVPEMIFKDFDQSLLQDVVSIYQQLPAHKVAPQQYVAMLQSCKKLYDEELNESNEIVRRLKTGIEKIQEATQSVDEIRKDVSQKKTEMEKKQSEADEALTKIQQKMEEATVQRNQSETIQKKLEEENTISAKAEEEIDKELSSIRPILAAAREAVGNIKSENLNEIRSLHMPPEAIRDVLEGVLMLLGMYDTSWVSMKKFLGQRGVKDTICNFDASTITPESRENVRKLVDQKASSFKHENIVRASVAAAPLASWVKANLEYSSVLERTKPLEIKQKQIKDNMLKGQEELQRITANLSTIDEKVEELKKRLRKKTQDAARLKDKLEKAENTLEAAEQLLSKLSVEQGRWTERLSTLDDGFKLMPKRCVLAGAFVAYLGGEIEEVRQSLMSQWKDKLKVKEFAFRTFLRTEAQLLEFKGEGLPGDDLSLDNAVLIQEATQTPLIVDPAHQAFKWLTAHLKKQKAVVDVCTLSDERFTHTLELAVRFGKTLIVCEVDRVDPILYPVMRRDLVSQGPKKVVQIGDKTVDWQDSFQLYLVTRNSFITLPPDAENLVTLVNFSITRGGLEGQLLGTAIVHEQPELEHQKIQLLKEEEKLKMELAGLEEKLLVDLSHAQGSLLENRALVDSLNTIKTQATSIAESLAQSRKLQDEMDLKREVYRPFARTGSMLFFLIRDLHTMNTMYQFSLNAFLSRFNKALLMHKGAGGADGDIESKISGLCTSLTQLAFLMVTQGIQKADRPVFGMHVVRGLQDKDMCSEREWLVFLGKADIGPPPASTPSWITTETTPAYRMVTNNLEDLCTKLRLDDDAQWKSWSASHTPETSLPEFLNPFQRLVMLKLFRPDRLLAEVTDFVCKTLRIPYLAAPLSFEQLLTETTPTDPILLVAAPGADPTMEIQSLAMERVGKAKFFQIAMGGGQTEVAASMLKRCAQDGSWLFLKNLHLVIAWLGHLEKELNSMQPHEDFRLWLTTEAHEQFPPILLTMSTKVTLEAPPGVKQNLQRTYGPMHKDTFSKFSPLQASVTFTLTWLHAILQERRTYIPQGFTKFYEFTPADWRAASDIVKAQCVGTSPDWVMLQGLLVNAIYGGRMDNDFDFRILEAYVSRLFNDGIHGLGCAQTPLLDELKVPMTNDLESHQLRIDGLPNADAPRTFSMPANADRVVQRTLVSAMEASLGLLHTGPVEKHMSREEWTKKVTPIVELWTSMCPPNASSPSLPTKRGPMETFVSMEYQNVAKMLETVKAVMHELDQVIKGTALLSNATRELSHEMIAGNAPDRWAEKVSGPTALQPWLRAFITKFEFAVSNINTYNSGGLAALFQQKWSLCNVLRPQALLSALRQHTARQSGQSLMSLALTCGWGPSSHINSPVVLSLDTKSMMIQGATMSADGSLSDVDVDDVGVVPTTDCAVAWVPAGSKASGMTVPVYADQTRESLLMELNVPVPAAQHSEWTLKGIALMVDFF
eukprot:PhM_4_TR13906/c0_g1_i1/m.49396/K10414/DYNC2H, DNCH2; dynein heavy chain 2, cytosolic